MQLLDQLRRTVVDGLDVEEAMFLLAAGSLMQATYQSKGVEVPEWLNESVEALDKEVDRRYRDSLERELKEIEAREEALKTAQEKRQDLGEKKQRILKALGKGTAGGVVASSAESR